MKLTQQRVVTAALDVLNKVGLDGLTMRAVSEHLGVQHNTVHWHAQSKGRLLELMADAMIESCLQKPLPKDWEARVRELARRCRHALLHHRDGARLFAGISVPGTNTLQFAEKMVGTLLAAGFPPQLAARTHWLIFYLTLGITQEQQAMKTAEVSFPDVAADEYPSLAEASLYLGATDFDERFEFGVTLLLEAAASHRKDDGD